MARIRSIKPDFFRHEALYEAEKVSGLPLRVAFAGLWTAADREGRFRWQPRALKLDCLPYDDCDFALVLDALASSGLVVKYLIDGESFGFIPTWKIHQVINLREAQSKIPEPSQERMCAHVHAHGEGKGREREGKEKDAAVAAPGSEEKQIYDLGKELLGSNSGGVIKKLIVAKDGALPLAHAALLTAKTKSNPREYIGAIIRSRDGPADNGRSF